MSGNPCGPMAGFADRKIGMCLGCPVTPPSASLSIPCGTSRASVMVPSVHSSTAQHLREEKHGSETQQCIRRNRHPDHYASAGSRWRFPGASRWTGATSPHASGRPRSEEHTSELQSRRDLVCRLLLEKKKKEQEKVWKVKKKKCKRSGG